LTCFNDGTQTTYLNQDQQKWLYTPQNISTLKDLEFHRIEEEILEEHTLSRKVFKAQQVRDTLIENAGKGSLIKSYNIPGLGKLVLLRFNW